ncbi:hypothetical protein F5B20DRAFT_580835 [Whalleya microplaca]|nr:hypothetical protein F5B20DRAFT_580835 [Whalleya microplaca]
MPQQYLSTYKVEPASDSDIPDLVALWISAFDSAFIRRIFPDTADGRTWLTRAFVKNLGPRAPCEPETKVMLVRDAEGLPVAMAVYRIVQPGCDPSRRSWRARWPVFDDLPGLREDVLADFFDPMERTQTHLLGSRGHMHLEALGTMEAHRKRGYGNALIKWGNDLADELGVECYLDASPAGRPVYEANGYIGQDVSAVVGKGAGASMVRSTKVKGS